MGKNEQEEQDHTAQGCPERELLYRHLLSSIEQNTTHYNFLMQRILTSAGFLSLAFTVLVVQYPSLLRGALASHNPALFFWAIGILASLAVFVYNFWQAVVPQKFSPVYDPSLLEKDYGDEPCAVYGRLIADTNDALGKNNQRNSALARKLEVIVASALVALVLMGGLIIYAA